MSVLNGSLIDRPPKANNQPHQVTALGSEDVSRLSFREGREQRVDVEPICSRQSLTCT